MSGAYAYIRKVLKRELVSLDWKPVVPDGYEPYRSRELNPHPLQSTGAP